VPVRSCVFIGTFSDVDKHFFSNDCKFTALPSRNTLHGAQSQAGNVQSHTQYEHSPKADKI
jgi:hypothetical protein